jgi:hypothetical protein
MRPTSRLTLRRRTNDLNANEHSIQFYLHNLQFSTSHFLTPRMSHELRPRNADTLSMQTSLRASNFETLSLQTDTNISLQREISSKYPLIVVYGFYVDAISKMIYDGRSQFQVHTDERTQVHSARLSLTVTHPSINRGRRALTSMKESLSKPWSPPRPSPP